MDASRRRLVVISGALMGVLLASALWLTRSSQSSPLTDAELRKRGFHSQQEYDRRERAMHTLTSNDGKSSYARLSEEQWKVVEETFATDQGKARVVTIALLGSLRFPDQQQRALALIRPCVGDRNLDMLTFQVLQQYAASPGRSVVEALLQDPNPRLAQLAGKSLKAVDERKAERAAAHMRK